ncbi:MAG: SBBP repeat-containing protein [Candidatus Odinarchaeota archaeon]
MKYKKIIIIFFLSLLCFGFLSGYIDMLNYENENNNNRNITMPPSISNINKCEWNKTLVDISDYGYGIAVDSLGNIYITGYAEALPSEGFIAKYDSDGNLLWNIECSGAYAYRGEIVADNMGNVFILEGKGFLGKYDTYGNEQWRIPTYAGRGIGIDCSGNAFITDYIESFGPSNRDVLLLKYDSDGNLLWNYTWGGFDDDYGHDVVIDNSGNIYITGITHNSEKTNKDTFILKYNSEGSLLWYKTWDIRNFAYYTLAIALDGLENVYIAGSFYGHDTSHQDVFLLKYDSDGNMIWYKRWDSPYYEDTFGIAVDVSGNAYITGYMFDNKLDYHMAFLVKYGVDTDNDGLSDNDEINLYFTNPNNFDTDFDGLSDDEELELGTNPFDADTDNDRFTDKEEVISGTDPLNFFDNWLFRGILISSSITALILGYIFIKKRIAKKNARKIKIILENEEEIEINTNLRESIKSYQERLLKAKDIKKYIPNSIRSRIMKLQITELAEKADKLKRKGEFIRALETLSLAGKIVDKITDKSIKEQLTRNILNILDSIYIKMIEKKIEEALKLREMKKFEESISVFNDVFSDVDKIRDKTLKDKNLSILKDYINTTRMIKTKDIIFNLNQNFERLEVNAIVEKCGEGEGIILSAILDMIKNGEISAEFIKNTKEVLFQKQLDVEQIDRLIKSFEDWEKEGMGKKK